MGLLENRVAETFKVLGGKTIVVVKKISTCSGSIRGDAARDGFKLLQYHAFGEHFRKNNWFFAFRGIKHVEWNTRAAKVLQ